MADIKIVQHNPHKPRYGPRLPKNEWNQLRPILESLRAKGKSLKETARRAKAEHGFRGTYPAMYRRFEKWGLTTPRSALQTDRDAVVSNVSNAKPGTEGEATLPNAVNDDTAGSAADADLYRTTSCSDDESPSNEDQTNSNYENGLQLNSFQIAGSFAESIPEPMNVAPTTVKNSLDNGEAGVVVQNQASYPSFLAQSSERSGVRILKRPRSLTSSKRSSWSSDTRSFIQHAKRLRYPTSVKSPTPSPKRLSVGSAEGDLLLGVRMSSPAELAGKIWRSNMASPRPVHESGLSTVYELGPGN